MATSSDVIISIFLGILEVLIQFSTFSKERWPQSLMYLQTYGLPKTGLDKCLKSPVSEDTSTGNMVNGPKHY